MQFKAGVRTRFVVCVCLSIVFGTSPSTVEAKNSKEQKQQKKAAKQHSNVKEIRQRELTLEQLEAMLPDYSAAVAAERRQMVETGLRRLEREYKAHQETGAPYVRDILIISGGGAKGAFGAGFLQGWQTVTGPTALPEFDVVTGVSTGALIAPFAFIGTEAAYNSVVDFYANPDKNWAHKRGMLYLKPSHVSLLNDDLLQEMIRTQLSTALEAVLSEELLPRADGKGLVAAFEVMTMTSSVANSIRDNKAYKITSDIQTGRKYGMITLDDFMFELYTQGTITYPEMIRRAQDPVTLQAKIKESGFDGA